MKVSYPIQGECEIDDLIVKLKELGRIAKDTQLDTKDTQLDEKDTELEVLSATRQRIRQLLTDYFAL